MVKKLKRLILNLLGRNAGYSGCGRCGDTWNWKEGHTTQYASGIGCFPLCQECWEHIKDPKIKLVYYEQLVNSWIQMNFINREKHLASWELIKKAVLEGK